MGQGLQARAPLGRAPLVASRLLAGVLLAAAAAGASAAEPFPIRMVKLGGLPADPAVDAHVAYAASIGFNALWVYSAEAGAWTPDRAKRRPVFTREFRRLAARSRDEGLELWVSVNPVADMRGAFVFDDPDGEERIVRFAALLHKRAGVRHLVLSFDDQPTELTELRDVLRYGRSAAAAHLDLARRIAPRLPAGMRLWLCAAAYCDDHLGAGDGPYARPFLEGLPSLPRSVGIVWTGPAVVSPSITGAALAATRARLGGRDLLLYDNFPMSDGTPESVFSLALAPLSGRDAAVAREVAAYLACPMTSALGASRLPLATIADYLRDPEGYDPKASRDRALRKIAGAGASDATWFALDTQQIEWGGTPRDEADPASAAARLHDPAFVASLTWTASRYPGRIAALDTLADTVVRDDLQRAMRRRLAVARALPLASEYLARHRAGRADAVDVLVQLQGERSSWTAHPEALAALETFLRAAGIPAPPERPS